MQETRPHTGSVALLALACSLIILVPSTHEAYADIPNWVRSIAGFWADGSISDSEYAASISWLIKNGIITIPSAHAQNAIQDDTCDMLAKDVYRASSDLYGIMAFIGDVRGSKNVKELIFNTSVNDGLDAMIKLNANCTPGDLSNDGRNRIAASMASYNIIWNNPGQVTGVPWHSGSGEELFSEFASFGHPNAEYILELFGYGQALDALREVCKHETPPAYCSTMDILR